MKLLKNILLLIALFVLTSIVQYSFDKVHAREPKPSPYVPNVEVVKAADLGLHSAAASLYWLFSIQYLGDWQTDNYQKLDDYIRLVTQLDPKFSHPYAFATLILPAVDQVDESIEIGKQGLEKADANWEIPYYIGTNYHMFKGDSANAAKYFDIAGRTPGAPDNIKWIAANYGSRPDLREQTIAIWQGIAENSDDPELQKRAEVYLFHFELMNFLEQAAAKYKEAYGTYPDPIEKLVEGRILSEIPKDPFGYKYYIDEDGRCRIKY